MHITYRFTMHFASVRDALEPGLHGMAEGIQQVFIKVSSKLSLKSQLDVKAHEMIHVKQFHRGELINNMISVINGRIYVSKSKLS
jgi:hypothetical protein